MARFRRDPGSAVRRAVGVFSCGIAWLTSACHGSLDLLVDRADAAVKVAPKDGGSDTGTPPSPARIPPIPCTGPSECAPVRGVCASDRGVCVECTSNGDCPRQRSCDTRTNRCIGCVDERNCPNGWTCDQLIHECAVSCTQSSDCPSPLFPICSPSRRVCTQCETD